MYLALKVIHIAALVVFLGNIVLAMVWKRDADRTGNPAIIAHVLHGIDSGDRWITVPSAAALFGSGLMLAWLAGLPLLRTGWIWQASIAFAFSGLVYLYPIGPDQRRMQRMAQAANGDAATMDWDAYRRVLRRWTLIGWLAILAVVAALVLMVVKPAI